MPTDPFLPDTIQEIIPEKKPSSFSVIFLNILLMIILTVIFWTQKWVFGGGCIDPFWASFGQVIASVSLFQVIWLHIRELLEKGIQKIDKIEIGPLKITLPSEYIFFLIDSLHIKFISAPKLWILAAAFSLLGIWLGGSTYSPFTLNEEPPLIQNFSVLFSPDGTLNTLTPRSKLQIRQDQSVRLEASILPQTSTICEWSTSEGTIFTGAGCSVQYIPPSFVNRDTLTVHAISACKTRSTFVTIFIEVIDP